MLKDGFILINKPASWTSFDVVAKLRTITGQKKIGHSGTLDPLATGLLLVAIGSATKELFRYQGLEKTYFATFELGKTSNTYDSTGLVVDNKITLWPSQQQLVQALAKFSGPLEQIPPMFSAKKIKGQKLYNLARAGQEITRPAAKITIFELVMLTYEPPVVTLKIRCSAGTYIRALAHDLGQALGTGAMMTELKRTAIGQFSLAQAVELTTLTRANWTSRLFS